MEWFHQKLMELILVICLKKQINCFEDKSCFFAFQFLSFPSLKAIINWWCFQTSLDVVFFAIRKSVVLQKSWACQPPSTFESSRIIIIPSYSIVWEKWLSSHRRSSLGASRNFACPRKLHNIIGSKTFWRRGNAFFRYSTFKRYYKVTNYNMSR